MREAQRDEHWLELRLARADALCGGARTEKALCGNARAELSDHDGYGADNPAASAGADSADGLYLGIDLGTSNVVSMVVDSEGVPQAVRLRNADVVRDGVVYDFFGAVTIVREQLAELEELCGRSFTTAATSFPPGTEPRISVNVIEAAGLVVSSVLDEPTAVAHMLDLQSAAVVDIGGGTTGVAVVRKGKVIFSADEPTGGHHISLTLAGGMGLSLPEAETIKKARGAEIWPRVRPVFEKMCYIVEKSLQNPELKGCKITEMLLSGGSCTLPGVQALFQAAFPKLRVSLPSPPIFITPLAIACSAMESPPAEKKRRA